MKLKFVLKHYSLHEYTDPFFSKVKITTRFFTCIENTAITVQLLHHTLFQVAQLTFFTSLLKAIFLLMTSRASRCFLSEALSWSRPQVSTLNCKSHAANHLFFFLFLVWLTGWEWFLHCKMVERNQKDILWHMEIEDIWLLVFTYKILLAYSLSLSLMYCLWPFSCYSDTAEDLPQTVWPTWLKIFTSRKKIAHLSSSS